jgi:hypothetical protein
MKSIKKLLLSVYAFSIVLLFTGNAYAASLIPAGALTDALSDITLTGQDAFSLIVPVVVVIAALLIAVKLIKRFLNKA